jgi:hypothetical protein
MILCLRRFGVIGWRWRRPRFLQEFLVGAKGPLRCVMPCI